MFYKPTSRGKSFLVIFVDGIVIMEDDIKEIDELKVPATEFHTKDLRNVKHFLVIEVAVFLRYTLILKKVHT